MTGSAGRSPQRSLAASVLDWILARRRGGDEARAGAVCAFCGAEAPPGSIFCPRDGRALSAALLPSGANPLTVLFTDIEDSVQLTERLGDAVWAGIVDEHNHIVRESIAGSGGFEVKATGDGFLIVFAEPIAAARCAIDIQRRIAAHLAQQPAWPVRVRIGIHRGDVILRPGGDVLGQTVNVAQRIMVKASAGEIWASQALYDAVAPTLPADHWADRGMRRLRGLPGRERLYQLLWSHNGDETGATTGRPLSVFANSRR